MKIIILIGEEARKAKKIMSLVEDVVFTKKDSPIYGDSLYLGDKRAEAIIALDGLGGHNVHDWNKWCITAIVPALADALFSVGTGGYCITIGKDLEWAREICGSNHLKTIKVVSDDGEWVIKESPEQVDLF